MIRYRRLFYHCAVRQHCTDRCRCPPLSGTGQRGKTAGTVLRRAADRGLNVAARSRSRSRSNRRWLGVAGRSNKSFDILLDIQAQHGVSTHNSRQGLSACDLRGRNPASAECASKPPAADMPFVVLPAGQWLKDPHHAADGCAEALGQRLAISTAITPERNTPSDVPAPPIEAIGAPRSEILWRLSRSAPMRVPRLPLI